MFQPIKKEKLLDLLNAYLLKKGFSFSEKVLSEKVVKFQENYIVYKLEEEQFKEELKFFIEKQQVQEIFQNLDADYLLEEVKFFKGDLIILLSQIYEEDYKERARDIALQYFLDPEVVFDVLDGAEIDYIIENNELPKNFNFHQYEINQNYKDLKNEVLIKEFNKIYQIFVSFVE